MHPLINLLLCFLSPVALLIAAFILFYVFCKLMTWLHIGDLPYPFAWKAVEGKPGEWISPMQRTYWIGDSLLADYKPARDNDLGVYCAKNYFNWSLHLYWALTSPFGGRILKVRMSEPVAEHAYGYRANYVELARR